MKSYYAYGYPLKNGYRKKDWVIWGTGPTAERAERDGERNIGNDFTADEEIQKCRVVEVAKSVVVWIDENSGSCVPLKKEWNLLVLNVAG